MTTAGQMLLLAALVASGWAAFACLAGALRDDRKLWRTGLAAAIAATLALSVVSVILARALVAKDFSFRYVALYASQNLPWHYAASAFWVGQAGSLLLWAWMMAVVSMAFLAWPATERNRVHGVAFGVLMACLAMLVAVMVFAANPMEQCLSPPRDGAGLSPLLQHPAMLIHPPIVFLGYAGWAVPFALAAAALALGRLDAEWVRQARPWALLSWCVLGVGILLGANWAYEELGWGGYWAWDPVENGSLIPWLTGTALVHVMMVWQYRGALKKTALSLAIATFGLCNFATFLTRSGIFSSLHAFSQSSIGWMFLGLMVVLALGGGVLIAWRRSRLTPAKPLAGLWTREALVVVSTLALLLLAGVTVLGTAWVPLSSVLVGRKIMVGTAFYNNVLIPTGLVLLGTTALAPLVRWGKPPTTAGRRMLLISAGTATVAAAVALVAGLRHPVGLAVVWGSALAVAALVGCLWLDARRREAPRPWTRLAAALASNRRQYAGFLLHLGFVCLALSITGTSLGTRRHEAVMTEGQTIHWAGRTIRYVRLAQQELPDKYIFETELEITPDGSRPYTLRPAQHLHKLQEEWTTEVAIRSTWASDFYVILHYGEKGQNVRLTFLDNPMMRWMWLSGWVAVLGVAVRMWPARRPVPPRPEVPAPHRPAARRRRRGATVASKGEAG